MTDCREYAKRMPVDQDLLEPLGRVMWAAIRLHHVVRDVINNINGTPSDKPFDLTLGAAVKELARLASTRLDEPDRTALLTWIADEGWPVVWARNGVAHAVSYTDTDGRQALRGTSPDRPSRYLEPELLEVAGVLAIASRNLPRGPYHGAEVPSERINVIRPDQP